MKTAKKSRKMKTGAERLRRSLVKAAEMAAVIVLLAVFAYATAEPAHASGDLTVKVGFYGGPYYELKNYSESRMESMSGGVNIYSGVDSGNFMRLCYAYGVPVSSLMEDAGVDVSSVKYLHMGTKDGYGEGYTTFAMDQLMGSRNFYPHMVDLVDKDGGSEQTIDFSKVDEKITKGAKAVPTIIAVGNSGFSRDEAVYAGKYGYRDYSRSDLKSDGYRLVFGQSSLTQSGARNVQQSDKWIFEINIQLSGAPDIIIEKELIEGKDGEVGAKYALHVRINLPGNYSYLSDEIMKKLEQQVLENLRISGYDKSVVKITKTADGEYIAEVVGEGDTRVKVNYSRREYGGGLTTSTGSTSISGKGGGSGTGSGTKPDGSDHGTGGGGTGGGTGTGTGSGTGTSPGDTDPTKPGGTDPAPTDPIEPTDPVEPTEPVTEPSTDNTEPASSDSTTEPATDPEQPAEPSQKTEPETEKTEPTTETKPSQQTQPTTLTADKGSGSGDRHLGISDKNGDSDSPSGSEKDKDAQDDGDSKDKSDEPVLTADSGWVAADSIASSSTDPASGDEKKDLLGIILGAGALFAAGAGGTLITFYRRL